jgi:DNA ligase (NAD+)
MDGFGEKSFINLTAGIENARKTTLDRLIYGLGIPNVGLVNARMICRAFDDDPERIRHAGADELILIEGIGPVIAESFETYFADEKNQKSFDRLLAELVIEKTEKTAAEGSLTGKVFVITGAVHHFANRNEAKAAIEERGGKVTGSVSARTDYLVNNDVNSSSSKNRKARELGIPVISEEELLELLQ